MQILEDTESTWPSATLIAHLSRIAALFHDFGKINSFFSHKLKQLKRSKKPIADPFRHEWISLRLFEAFIQSHQSKSDSDWINTLITVSPQSADVSWLNNIVKDYPAQETKDAAFTGLPPIAKIVAWLIISHHRLPTPQSILLSRGYKKETYAVHEFTKVFENIDFTWCFPRLYGTGTKKLEEEIEQCWKIEAKDIPFFSETWCQESNQCASQLKQWLTNNESPEIFIRIDDPYLSHVSRMVLMLSDHYYSSCAANPQLHDCSYKRYANTDRLGNLKQYLDDHLVGVSQSVHRLMGALTQLDNLFNGLASQPNLEVRTNLRYYQWQDNAYQLACDIQRQYPSHGFFGVNLASTGRGKTLANTKIMYGLADPAKGARFNVAMGLRTLTLQTGQALRDKLNLKADDLAIMVGGGAVKELFEYQKDKNKINAESEQMEQTAEQLDPAKNDELAACIGSESRAGLHNEDIDIDFSGQLSSEHIFAQWLKGNEQIQKMLMSPILCCTIDHLMPATENTRGGGQIAPMLRLMSSDLIFDEPDDFSPEDYYALSRLVYWAGLMGSRVLLSSATLMPAEINGLYLAYSSGRKAFNLHRTQADQAIIAAWFDENTVNHKVIACDQKSSVVKPNQLFAKTHQEFTKERVSNLKIQAKTNKRHNLEWVGLAKKLPIEEKWEQVITRHVLDKTLEAHHLNAITDPVTQKKYSVGLMRFANIDPLAAIAQQLLKHDIPSHVRLHLCVYHSRFPLLMRNHIEQYLDEILDRNKGQQPHDHQLMKTWLKQYPEQEHIVLVMASPVCEVGRDHDFDWLILDPSSMRSMIQASGRVRRHRHEAYDQPNIFLMESNIRHYRKPDAICFFKPGFEDNVFKMQQHYLKWSCDDLDDGLISKENFAQLDSTARLRPNPPDTIMKSFRKKGYFRLADLEHDRMMHVMLNRGVSRELDIETAYGEPKVSFPVYRFWDSPIQYTGVLQQLSQFRASQAEFLVTLRAEQASEPLKLYQYNLKTGRWGIKESYVKRIILTENAKINCWPNQAPEELLLKYLDINKCAGKWQDHCGRYLSLNLPEFEPGRKWQYHDWLGFIRD